MKRFALIIGCDDYKKDENNNFLLMRKICFTVRKAFMPDINKITVRKIGLYDNVEANIIKLPYSSADLADFSKVGLQKIGRRIEDICKVNSIEKCLVSGPLQNVLSLGGGLQQGFDGRYVFRVLLLNIIRKICDKKRKSINDLDIAIICDNNFKQIAQLIELLLPYFRYITVITEDPNMFEEDMEIILENSGLSVVMDNESKNVLKNKDVIINFKNLSDDGHKNLKIDSKTVIINYGSVNNFKCSRKNVIIDGIKIKLPEIVREKIGREIYREFFETELAEMIFVLRACMDETVLSKHFDYGLVTKLREHFKKDGYSISGFKGYMCDSKYSDAY